MMFLPMEKFAFAILAITPGSISALLVFPIPNYHNVMTVIIECYQFFTSQQKYVWKGWCFMYESKNDRQDNSRLDQGPTRNQ